MKKKSALNVLEIDRNNDAVNEQELVALRNVFIDENDDDDVLSRETQCIMVASDIKKDSDSTGAITECTKYQADGSVELGTKSGDDIKTCSASKTDRNTNAIDGDTYMDIEKDGEAQEKKPQPKEPWHLVPFVLMSYMILTSITMSFSVLYVDLAWYFDISMGTAGWIASVQFFFRTAGSLVTGALIAKRGCRLVACVGSIMAFVSLVISAFAPNIWILMLSYGLMCGLGTSMIQGSCMAIVQQSFHANRTLASSICMSGTGLGATLGPIWFDFLMRQFGWRGAFVVHAGVSLHAFAFGLFFRSSPDFLTKSKSIFRNALDFSLFWKNRVFGLFCVCQLLFAFNTSAFFRHVTSRAIFMGYPRTQAALLTTCLGGTVALSRFSLGFITNLKQLDKILTLSIAVIVGGVISGLRTWFVATSLGWSAAVVIGFAICQAMVTPLVQVVITKIETVKNFPKANSFVMVTQSLPSLISMPLTGWIFDTTGNYNLPFLINGSVQIISGCICLTIIPLHRRRQKLHSQNEKDMEYVSV